MEQKGVTCHINTVRNRISEAGIKYLSPLKKPMLNDTQCNYRLSWAQQHQEFEWDKVIFTDESSFYTHTMVRRLWRRRGKKR